MNPLIGILRHAFRNDVNILCAPTHERYQSNLKNLPYNFHMVNHESFVKWKTDHSEIPSNHYLWDTLPNIPFDIVFTQNKFSQFQILSQIAYKYNIPIVSLEHTLPPPNKEWQSKYIEKYGNMQGSVNVFISDFSRKAWGFNEENSIVINHCVDTDIFFPSNLERNNVVLTVANDYINRNMFLNFNQYVRVTNGLPTVAVGDTPGLSKPASSINELVNFYRTSRVFLNTAHVSPIPMSLLEAMACGCCVVSCKTCAIPEYVEHGVTGFLAENDEEMRFYLERCLNDKKLSESIGYNASISIREKFSKGLFESRWNEVFKKLL